MFTHKENQPREPYTLQHRQSRGEQEYKKHPKKEEWKERFTTSLLPTSPSQPSRTLPHSTLQQERKRRARPSRKRAEGSTREEQRQDTREETANGENRGTARGDRTTEEKNQERRARRQEETEREEPNQRRPQERTWKIEVGREGRRGHHSSPSTLSLSIVHALYPTHEESGHNTSYREGEEHYRTQRGKKSSTEEKENDEESHCTVQEESKDQKDLRREECKGRTQTEHILHDEEERTVHNTDRTARGRAEGSTGEECKGRQHREDTSTDREEECGV
jgi:hypothetical protein